MSGRFENVLKVLEYNAGGYRASVLLGTKGIFGATYEEAVKSQAILDEYELAIATLEKRERELEAE
jgi:hypothetical protein